MLMIREAQNKVFEERARHAFELEMVAHLAEFSPPLFKTLGERAMLDIVRFGMARAAQHGFDLRGPVRLYLEMMLLFGSYFDTDPQYPWAADVLADRDAYQMQRAEQLYGNILDYQEKVDGPDDVYAQAALGNIRLLAQQPLGLNTENFADGARYELTRIYPQKAAYIGNTALDALIRKGMDGARRQRFVTGRGAFLVVVLMLAFGHGCGADPLYPWIVRTLRDEKITDPETRAKRLEKKALTWLEHVLANFGKGERV
ncbi:MAG: hypothetical protein JNM60_12615 [Candidatus Competibacteraceae bacterium]|nr:hypothetical protein [Candidatus Competibacteraceae bacterium]